MILFLILLSLLMIGFFCGSEMGLISSDRIRLHHMEKMGSHGAKRALYLLSNPERYLSTILVGTNLALVATTSLTTVLLYPRLNQMERILLPFLLTFIILFFGEILPKVLFRIWAVRTTLLSVRPLEIFYYLLYPLIFIITQVTRGILAFLSIHPPERSPLVPRRSLEVTLKESLVEGILHPREGKAISSIFSFSKMEAGDVMTPREKIFALPIHSSHQEILEEVSRRDFEQIPIYESTIQSQDNLDSVIGILRVTDLLKEEEIRKILHPVLFVSDTTGFHDLLTILREDVNHFALVRNEKGRVVGLVTLDDILKELFGEIREEI